MSEVILYTTDDGRTRIAQATVNPQLTVQIDGLRREVFRG